MLVDSFGSTLQEIESADVVVLMEDVSHPMFDRQREVAYELIKKVELGELLGDNRLIRVWNKIDCITNERLNKLLANEEKRDDIVLTSASNGIGLDLLKEKLE